MTRRKGRRSLASLLERTREWEIVRDDGTNSPGRFDVKTALTGVAQSYAVRTMGFVHGIAEHGAYMQAVDLSNLLDRWRAQGLDPAVRFGLFLDRRREPPAVCAQFARTADEMAETLRAEIHGELTGLGHGPGRLGADARRTAGYALELAREWEAVAAVCRERTAAVDLDALPPNG